MRDDPRIRQARSGIIAVLEEHLPAAFGIAADPAIGANGTVLLRPPVVVAARSRLAAAVLDAAGVGTVIEIGRAQRRRLADRRTHEAAGLHCVWRIELSRHPGYRGPVPAIFVRTRLGLAWRERFALRGVVTDLPLCVGDAGAGPQWISVPIDPGWLTC